MTLEVELKFKLADARQLLLELAKLKAVHCSDDSQSDHYYNHPSRDFSKTDEAFRVRVQRKTACLTYKGPRLDQETKTRREIEVDLADAETSVRDAESLFENLGFRSVGKVVKQRKTYQVMWESRQVTLTLDDVEGLGSFIEIELVVDESDWKAAKVCLLSFASRLGLESAIHTSYLELLLESQS